MLLQVWKNPGDKIIYGIISVKKNALIIQEGNTYAKMFITVTCMLQQMPRGRRRAEVIYPCSSKR
jgi:hypothetical protein